MSSNPSSHQALKLILSLIALTIAGLVIFRTLRGDRRGGGTLEDELAGWKMGTEISSLHGSGNQIVLLLPGTEDTISPSLQTAFKAFKEAVEDQRSDIQIIPVDLYALLAWEGQEEVNPVLLFESGLPPILFDLVHDQHPEAQLIVSFAGLPARFKRPEFRLNQGPAIAALDLMMVSGNAWQAWLDSGYARALILPKADIQYDLNLEDMEKENAFAERFVYLTPGNWKEMLPAVQGLF